MKPTIKDVALASGFSTATVSRVLNRSGYVSPEVAEKVYAAVERLKYRPNAIARSLKQDKTHTIGIIVPDISNDFFMSACKGIEDIVHPYGYNIIICSGEENAGKEAGLLHLLFEKRVDAIVLASSGRNEESIERISGSGVPVILLDRKIEMPETAFDYVGENNATAAYKLTKRLLEQGHMQIGVINGTLSVSTAKERLEGFTQAMHEYGVSPDPRLMREGHFTLEGGREAAQHLMNLPERPTAIVSFNNKMTFGALIALTSQNMRIPEQIALASYGEVEAVQLLQHTRIEFLKQDPYAMGFKAGEVVMARLDKRAGEPGVYLFDPELHH